jgi:ribonucleoside-diphosphate reductase alpha chain
MQNRERLPKHRIGYTYEIMIDGTKVFLRTGLYDDGKLGEIFVDVAKFGSELRSLIHCWAVLFSIALQHGTPLEQLVHTFEGVKFAPCGTVSCAVKEITSCSSIPDCIVRILAVECLKR